MTGAVSIVCLGCLGTQSEGTRKTPSGGREEETRKGFPKETIDKLSLVNQESLEGEGDVEPSMNSCKDRGLQAHHTWGRSRYSAWLQPESGVGGLGRGETRSWQK